MHNNDKYEQKGTPPIAAQTTKFTKHTVASSGQDDEGSENGMFEDPLYSLSKSLGIHGVDTAHPLGYIGASTWTCSRPRRCERFTPR